MKCAVLRSTTLFFLTAFVVLLIGGCTKLQGRLGMDHHLPTLMEEATSELLRQASEPVEPGAVILVANLSPVDDLEHSSTFGRTVSEYIVAALSRIDFQPVELKLADSVYFRKHEGTFLLSRDVREISAGFQARMVIVGTYSVGEHVCYLTLRLVRANDNVVLSAVDRSIPLGSETRTLLGFSRY